MLPGRVGVTRGLPCYQEEVGLLGVAMLPGRDVVSMGYQGKVGLLGGYHVTRERWGYHVARKMWGY